MSPKVRRIRRPVRRLRAEEYLLISLLSFGFSVGVTRLFLQLTGFPEIGNSEYHISHILWGGLALFIAALLPLIFANRWVYLWGAALAGIGVGLFIDEVGKFITQTNDYFFPPAAPIIYGFFLATVLVYFQVRKPAARDDRVELYHALDSLEEILDHDLEPGERAELERRLKAVALGSENPNFSTLAGHLLEFIQSEPLSLSEDKLSLFERLEASWSQFGQRWLTTFRLKAVLIGFLSALGIFAVLKLVQLLLPFPNPQLSRAIEDMILIGRISSPAGVRWFIVRVALEGISGALLIASAALLLMQRDQAGVSTGVLGLVLSLTTVNLLVFYFDQFATILIASIQFLALLLLLDYRKRTAYEP